MGQGRCSRERVAPVLLICFGDERQELDHAFTVEFFPDLELGDPVDLKVFAQGFIGPAHGQDAVDRAVAWVMIAKLRFHVPGKVGGDEVLYAFGCPGFG